MISFNFSKKKEKTKLLDSKLRDESTLDDKDVKDFVVSVQGNEIHGTKKKEEKKELVIPLITKNQWKVGEGGGANQNLFIPNGDSPPESPSEQKLNDQKIKTSGIENDDTISDLDKQAINELLNDTNSEVRKNGSEVPLLLQNQVPNGFEEDDNMDVSLRPDQSTIDDYERIPIEEFGMAMLRGMGWKKTEGIGLTNKKDIVMLEPQLRPKGLGLGAERPKTSMAVGPSSAPQEEEQLQFKKGAAVVLTKGSDKGMYGRIESLDLDNNRVIVKLAINKKSLSVSMFNTTVVPEKEFEKKSKVLNNDQYDEYKKKADEKNRRHRESEDSKRREREYSPEEKRKKMTDSSSSRKYSEQEKSRDKNSNRYDDNFHKSSGSNSTSKEQLWVRPNLKVRFIDKKYKHGKYYEKKFIVVDVVEKDSFVLRSEHGNSLLEDICTSQLETVIPRDPHTPICILHGKRKGKVGELIEKNKRKETAIVKLDETVLELSYDDICEFVGDPEEYN